MIRQFTFIFFLVCWSANLSFAQQQKATYKLYSYTEFFELIKQEKDTIFTLNDAVIQFNEETDERFRFAINPLTDSILTPSEQIVIDKSINLNNVHFSSTGWRYPEKYEDIGSICNVHFKRDVTIHNTTSLNINNCKFDGLFESRNNEVCSLDLEELRQFLNSIQIAISRSQFTDFFLDKNCQEGAQALKIYTQINKNTFNSKKRGFALYLVNNGSIALRENNINVVGTIYMILSRQSNISIIDNKFKANFFPFLILRKEGSLNFQGNSFSSYVNFNIDKLDPQDYIQWSEIKNYFVSSIGFSDYFSNDEKYKRISINSLDTLEREQVIHKYLDSVRYYNKSAFTKDMASKGLFYDHYRSKYETETANEVYMEMKDMETRRLGVLYSQNPSFKTYFKWKVNQFLKVFSDYGTEPSKAIVFSMYVILAFALIYLFFPNSWDSHGKNRIVDRYSFFFKYMKKDAGIHEVYLEEKSQELMAYDEFKNLIATSKKSVPKFFSATAFPIYKWAISGTKLSASLLSRIDIMRGTWEEMPPAKKAWKSFLLVSAFLIAIAFDLLIKMLNALMLSINTFTTLGFGEIPIKGLPRYLAIIQGFIGWFMLTIFSVSLISQLLN